MPPVGKTGFARCRLRRDPFRSPSLAVIVNCRACPDSLRCLTDHLGRTVSRDPESGASLELGLGPCVWSVFRPAMRLQTVPFSAGSGGATCGTQCASAFASVFDHPHAPLSDQGPWRLLFNVMISRARATLTQTPRKKLGNQTSRTSGGVLLDSFCHCKDVVSLWFSPLFPFRSRLGSRSWVPTLACHTLGEVHVRDVKSKSFRTQLHTVF